MIDKTTEKWQSLPLLFRLNFAGSEVSWLGLSGLSQRKYWIRGEKLSALAGLALCPLGIVHKDFFAAGLFMIVCAYGLSLVTRMGDEYAIW